MLGQEWEVSQELFDELELISYFFCMATLTYPMKFTRPKTNDGEVSMKEMNVTSSN